MIGKLKHKTYPVEELNGIVFIFIGDIDPVPPLKDDVPPKLYTPKLAIQPVARNKIRGNWRLAAESAYDAGHIYGHRKVGIFDNPNITMPLSTFPSKPENIEVHDNEEGPWGIVKKADDVNIWSVDIEGVQVTASNVDIDNLPPNTDIQVGLFLPCGLEVDWWPEPGVLHFEWMTPIDENFHSYIICHGKVCNTPEEEGFYRKCKEEYIPMTWKQPVDQSSPEGDGHEWGFNNFDSFGRKQLNHVYQYEDFWHREHLIRPDIIISKWRLLANKRMRGIQNRDGNWTKSNDNWSHMSKETKKLEFSKQQRSWFDTACANINPQRLQQIIQDLTAIHSPTGAERQASEFMVDYMLSVGIDAHYQAVTKSSGNCIGEIKGTGQGPTLMLYAPVDTHLEAEAGVDIPWAGPELRADMLPDSSSRGDTVIGLGASNPKSLFCTLVEAATAVVESGAEFKGNLIIAACGGGMPWIVSERDNAGISSGVMYMLSHGVAPDAGIIFKPGDEVYYEHPGMCWFKVTVKGTMGYAGLPRGIPGFRSSIVPAAKVILDLEQWLGDYPEAHQSTQVRPEGWISAVRSGWPEKPAFPSAATQIYIDIRTTPEQTNASLKKEFDVVMNQIQAKYDDVEAEWEMYVSCQASCTEPTHWIVESAIRGWEERYGKPYPGAAQTSGQTDAATINQLGIPLVRIGYPFASNVPEEFSEGLGGMGVAKVSDLLGPCQSVIYSIIDICTRERAELEH